MTELTRVPSEYYRRVQEADRGYRARKYDYVAGQEGGLQSLANAQNGTLGVAGNYGQRK
jgi:hypothetical protein